MNTTGYLENSCTAEDQLIASRLCLCTQKTNLFADIKENGK